MKYLIATLISAFALSAMATDAPKTPATSTVTVTAPAAPNKNETKPVKSEKKVEAKETKTK